MKKKDLYSEIGRNYRYFLGWRHRLLAGYLVTVSGLAIAFSWTYSNNVDKINRLSWIVLLLGFIITLVFWSLECRNRKLYRTCQNAGSHLEKYKGVYTDLIKSRGIFSHSGILNAMFIIAALGFLMGFIFTLCDTI